MTVTRNVIDDDSRARRTAPVGWATSVPLWFWCFDIEWLGLDSNVNAPVGRAAHAPRESYGSTRARHSAGHN